MKMISLLLLTINFINMEYKVLDWEDAVVLKNSSASQFLMMIEFNQASVYKLKDSSLLVMPLNPFGKSIVTKHQTLIDEWISRREFPTKESRHQFYNKNKKLIDNFNNTKDSLQTELLDFVFSNSELSLTDEEVIENVYKKITEKKQFKKYELGFIILVGNYLIKKNPNYTFALIESKQLLNPIKSIILIDNNIKNEYFELEDVCGKNIFADLNSIKFIFTDFRKKTNEFENIQKI